MTASVPVVCTFFGVPALAPVLAIVGVPAVAGILAFAVVSAVSLPYRTGELEKLSNI